MRWRRAQRVAAALLPPLTLAAIALRCAVDPEIPWVAPRAAGWVMPATRVSAELQQWGRREVPLTRFLRRVELEGAAPNATLRLRALRHFELYVNGERVDARAPSDWRRETAVEIGSRLRAGANELRVDVRNPRGPALLALRVEGLAAPLRSDASWSVELDGTPLGPAVPADDTRVNPGALTVPTPWRSLVAQRDAVAALFAAGALGFAAAARLARRAPGPFRRLPALALLAAALAWLALLPGFLRIPLEIGFDARHHRAYVEHVRSEAALPLATDGWSSFHPPLFYAAVAAVTAAAGGGDAPRLAFRLIPFLAGLGTVVVAWALARRLFPGDARVSVYATAFAAVLPVNVYVAGYFSNEGLHALLANLALLAGVAALLAERTDARRVASLALLLGLAALTKFTALALVPVALLFLAGKQLAIDRAPPGRAVAAAALFAATLLAVAGWYYARNWLVLGDPIVTNWGFEEPGRVWWQQPGFRTLAYYTGFGESLRHPFLAGFHSFWDAAYSTFWGDGFIAGRVNPWERHPHWNYEFMSLGYLLALPATALLALGAGLAVAAALRGADARRCAAFSFLATAAWAVLAGFLYLSLRVPFYSQVKATYGLALVAPAALCFGMGAARVDAALAERGWQVARAALHGWLAALLGALYLSYA